MKSAGVVCTFAFVLGLGLPAMLLAEEGATSASANKVPPADIQQKTMQFLCETEISGFVSMSYFHGFGGQSKPVTPGTPELVNLNYITRDDEFMVNKIKLVFDNAVEPDPENWSAGYRVDMLYGDDASILNFGGGQAGLTLGNNGVVQQAYVAFNAPVGNGLVVKAGKLVTLLGVEYIEETANPNWTPGNQWFYVEPFTHAGALLSYQFSDKVDGQFMIANGWDVLPDNNSALSYMARLGFTMNESSSLGVIYYQGPEQANDNDNIRSGWQVILTHKASDKLTTYIQVDYGHEEDLPGVGPNSHWYAGGIWFVYQCCDKCGFAIRADYLKDADSTRTLGLGVANPGDTELASLTATWNITPTQNLQIRPEVRLDRASEDGFDGHDAQVTAGVGVAYLY